MPASSDISLPDDPTVLLGKVERILKKPDLTIGNLEGTMTRRGSSKCGAGSSNCYAFRAPPSNANLLDRAGYDVMNLANNHAFDFGKVGLADTRAALDGVGIAYTGAPGQVTVREVEGVRVGIVGFASYKWSAPLNNLPASRSSCRRPTRGPTSSSSPSTAARRAATSARADGRETHTARTAATCARSRGRRSTRAPISSSAPGRTSCAASSSTRAA